jgi:trehalose synthase
VPFREVDIRPLSPRRLAPVIGAERVHEMAGAIREATGMLGSRTVVNVNSTAVGGGVAELLEMVLGYARGGGVATRWFVIEGSLPFFELTKRIHNGLYGSSGDGGELGASEHELYEQMLARNAGEIDGRVRRGDIVLLHDPQTAGLAPAFRRLGATIVWRCHVGSDQSNEWTERSWRFLRPYLEDVDGYVFSSPHFRPAWVDPARTHVISPSRSALAQEHGSHPVRGACAAGGRRIDRTLAVTGAGAVSAWQRSHRRAQASGSRGAGVVSAAGGRAPGRPDLAVGLDEGHGRRDGGICREL